MKSPLKLLLYCDVLNSRFTLSAEGEDWSMTFDSWEAADDEAKRRVTEATPLSVCNEHGKEIARDIVRPTLGQADDKTCP